MNEAKARAQLIKAIENPFRTILGHITGRQLPGRWLLLSNGWNINAMERKDFKLTCSLKEGYTESAKRPRISSAEKAIADWMNDHLPLWPAGGQRPFA